MAQLVRHRRWQASGSAAEQLIGGMRPDEDPDLLLAIALSKSLMVRG